MRTIVTLLLVFFAGLTAAQTGAGDKPAYPQDYFRNPLDIPIFLAGNFGECRPGHFHSGVDIKTLGAENQPVHAAAEGYVSRIKMESGGFGHGLYITHPNGYTTLYAHLNKFAPAIQKYVEEQQYKQKRWNVDLPLAPGQFQVKKGEEVAWSGNTGASTAPHLHFEIRNSKTEHPLNPQLFGLPIVDNIPPVPAEVVFYEQAERPGFYNNSKLTMTLEKKGDTYKPAKLQNDAGYHMLKGDTVYLLHDNIGIGINADDYMNGSDNTIAFYTTKLYLNDTLQAQVTLDNIGYDETRYINAYTDYGMRQRAHKWAQCLFQLPGNRLNGIYTFLNADKGRIRLKDKEAHRVRIDITDNNGNTSTISFYAAITPYNIGTKTDHIFSTPFYAGRVNAFSNDYVSFTLDESQLYDDINFVFSVKKDSGNGPDRYQLETPDVPVHHYFELSVKPMITIPTGLTGKTVIMYSDGKDEDGRAAALAENGWYKAKVRNFGSYWLDIDTLPPVIKPAQKQNANLGKAKQIAFDVKDDKTSVHSFAGYLDGEWICFEQHDDHFFYNFDAHCPKGKHKLIFKAEDENGNKAEYKLSFVR